VKAQNLHVYAPQSYMDTSTAHDPEENLADAGQMTSGSGMV